MSENREQYQNLSSDSPAEERPAPESSTTPVLPSAPAIKARDKHKTVLFWLGITECVIGGLSIVFAIATLSTEISSRMTLGSLFTYTSQGLWSGIYIFVTGVLGISAKKNPSVCMYKANMVLSILTAIFTPIGVVLSGFAIYISYWVTYLATLHVLITLMLIGGFVISIIHSAFCCVGLSGQRNHPGTVVYIPQAPTSHQIGEVPNGQYVVPGGSPTIQQHHNAQLMQPVAHHQIQVAVPPQTVYTNQVISPNAQYSGAQHVPHV